MKVVAAMALIALIAIISMCLLLASHDNSQNPNKSNFTIAVLPDTQIYSSQYPEIFSNQTRWVAANARAMGIAFLMHEGDVVDDGSSLQQYANANASMSVLDGITQYAIVPGNHDGLALYNEFFPAARYASQPWFGGNYTAKGDAYYLFSAGGSSYVVVGLEFCPPNDSIGWADGVLKANFGRKAIIVTHGYMDADGRRSVNGCSSTENIWDLAANNSNVFLILCGHAHGEALRSDRTGNRTVYQLLADYQAMPEGGNGWMRLMEFSPAEGKVFVRTYSPYLGAYERGADSEFVLDLQA